MEHLIDGFSAFSTFEGHKLPVKGILSVDESSLANPVDQFISFDMKQTLFWKVDRATGIARIIKQVKFSSERQHFIVAQTYLPKMRMFLFAAEDLTFKMFDRDLNLVESIRHQERHIAAMQYIDTEGTV